MTREPTMTETEVITLRWWAAMEAMPIQDESPPMLDAATDAGEPESSSAANSRRISHVPA